MSVNPTAIAKQRGMTKEVYAFLLRTYGRLPQVWIGLVLTVIHTLLMRVITIVVVARIASQIVTGDIEGAKISAGWYLAISLTALALRLSKEFVALRAENQEYGRLMVDYYRHIVNKDMAFFRDHQTGYIASTFRQHIDSALDLVRLLRGDIVQNIVMLTAPVVVLCITSWRIGLLALAIVIVQAIYIAWASAGANKHRARSHEIYRKISGVFSDDVTNIVAYKTSGSQSRALKTMRTLADEEIETFWQRRRTFALFDVPRDVITVIGTALAFWAVVASTPDAATSVGLVVMTITYMMHIFQNVAALPDLLTHHDDLVTKLYPTLEYITDKGETIKDPAKPKKLAVKKGAIDINHISFAYPDDRGSLLPVFTDFNLHIRGGEQIGVVGLSGAGKSTLASLLMRFDDITGGSITIDGTDIRDIRQADLREHIAYVPQEPLLFHRTIRENLHYFGAKTSDEEMLRATKAAHADEFIAKLPHGYDTLVGERGVKLSGGQKQRVVIARAILKNAPIMLFDEATSALDSESEKTIQKALPKIIGKRTAIVIAHRLSTVAGLDRIIVMHNGEIAEQGTHEELLKLRGRYYSLWQKQTAKEAA